MFYFERAHHLWSEFGAIFIGFPKEDKVAVMERLVFGLADVGLRHLVCLGFGLFLDSYVDRV